MADLKNVVYISNADYNTLITNGSVTVNGTTITYDPNDLYITPEENLTFIGLNGETTSYNGSAAKTITANNLFSGGYHNQVIGYEEGDRVTWVDNDPYVYREGETTANVSYYSSDLHKNFIPSSVDPNYVGTLLFSINTITNFNSISFDIDNNHKYYYHLHIELEVDASTGLRYINITTDTDNGQLYTQKELYYPYRFYSTHIILKGSDGNITASIEDVTDNSSGDRVNLCLVPLRRLQDVYNNVINRVPYIEEGYALREITGFMNFPYNSVNGVYCFTLYASLTSSAAKFHFTCDGYNPNNNNLDYSYEVYMDDEKIDITNHVDGSNDIIMRNVNLNQIHEVLTLDPDHRWEHIQIDDMTVGKLYYRQKIIDGLKLETAIENASDSYPEIIDLT